MTKITKLDPRETPPKVIKDFYKVFQKLPREQLDTHIGILDFNRGNDCRPRKLLKHVDTVSWSALKDACHLLDNSTILVQPEHETPVYEVLGFLGLRILPALLPEDTQRVILSKLLHRDLANSRHRTNVHLHHSVPYDVLENSAGSSFFHLSPLSSELFHALDDTAHKPFTVSQFLLKKLRWLTLGGQYDWTKKTYPPEEPPFPSDVAQFIHRIFPDVEPEAAIVNVYSPGDALSVHRDVTEQSDNGLVSISLGNDGIFVLGMEAKDDSETNCLAVRLRSGDAILMDGSARFAWHGLPRVIPNTCPEWLRDWPAGPANEGDAENPYEAWRGWMSTKRVNLNVRQIRD